MTGVVFSYTVGTTEVLETVSAVTFDAIPCIVRTLRIDPTTKPETVAVGRLPARVEAEVRTRDVQFIDCSRPDEGFAIFTAKCDRRDAHLHDAGGGIVRLTFPKSEKSRLVHLVYADDAKIDHRKFRNSLENWQPTTDPLTLTKGSPKRWGEPIVTQLVRGDESGPFAVDTLTIPYENRFNALFFCTGLDLPARWPHRRLHLPRRRVAREGGREGRDVLVAALRDRAVSPARAEGR